MRSHYSDWAAHNSADIDYISREQYKEAMRIFPAWLGWDYYRPSVWSATDQGTGGKWVRPRTDLTTRGWAYNVWNITNTGEATYR